MKKLAILILFSIELLSSAALSQAPTRTPTGKSRELKLRIIPRKEPYVLHDKLFTNVEFTNLSANTLCFPEPARDCEDSTSGSLIITGNPIASGDEQFICHRDGGSTWPRERLLLEIQNRWIKIAPNAVYVTRSADAQVGLDILGAWTLYAKYDPPQGAFDPAGFRKYIETAAEEQGCAVPTEAALAEPATITVVSKQDDK